MIDPSREADRTRGELIAMTQRELAILFLGFVFGSLVNQNRKAQDAGKERPMGVRWNVVIQLLPAGLFIGLALYVALTDLILIKIAFLIMMGVVRWEPEVLIGIPIAGVVSVFFAWVGVKLARKYNRRRLGVDAAFVWSPRTAKEYASSKATPHDLE